MKFDQFQASSKKSQQHATTHNMVCKRSQHVGPNNVASCWPTMLRAFARALTDCGATDTVTGQCFVLARGAVCQADFNELINNNYFAG